MQATVQTTDCWYSYTGYFRKNRASYTAYVWRAIRVLLCRLLGAAAAAACSLYSYSGGASLASDHKAFTPRGDASA